ncbi:endogenous retrovirus group 3 member 1 Env polyprotein-like [Candoia aspera]|uniref:endogenous retrovirus group 3 member 1 Env polyprotein-like n=1 Tax=Candoia aspera TaxID=51853 RepID=UPI002FD8066D
MALISILVLPLVLILLTPETVHCTPPQSCDKCVVSTHQGHVTIRTLVYHTLYKCSGNITTCVHNETRYFVCTTFDKVTCYQPSGVKYILHAYIYAYKGLNTKGRPLLSAPLASNPTYEGGPRDIQVCFDTCKAIDQGQGPQGNNGIRCGDLGWQQSYIPQQRYLWENAKDYELDHKGPHSNGAYVYWYTWRQNKLVPGPPVDGKPWFNMSRGITTSNCKEYTCTHLCLSFLDPPSCTWNIGIGVDGSSRDPYGQIVVRTTRENLKAKEEKAFYSFYEEMGTEIEIPHVAKKLFIDLAERIAESLNVTNCFVCGGINMGEQWPWEAREMNLSSLVNLTWSTPNRPNVWALSTSIIGHICFSRDTSIAHYNITLGDLRCENMLQTNYTHINWWSNTNLTQPNNPFSNANLSTLWTHLNDTSIAWTAPDGLYWICGKRAYVVLPPSWGGPCVLGTIKPSFFLLPIKSGEKLGIPVYDDIGPRSKRDLPSFKIGNWKDAEWPPERIIQVYGPATWAEDGSWGYRTPIYMLNSVKQGVGSRQ